MRVPYQLQVQTSPGSPISVCYEVTYSAVTNAKTNKTLPNCMYNQNVGYNSITFTVGQAYSGITLYYFYLGVIKNPSSVIYPDSFEVYFTGGTPNGSQTSGLTVTYLPNNIYNASLTHLSSQAGTIDTYTV